jgi:hypothetical protein
MDYYPIEIFVREPSPNFICSICFNVFKDPVFCSIEGQHNFCTSCIIQTPNCAFCHCVIDHQNLIISRHFRNEIGLLEVKCQTKYDEEACVWTGTLDAFKENHLKSECPLIVIACPNPGCVARMIRRSIQAHSKNACCFRIVECEYCNENMIHNNLNFHHNVECEEILLPCSNGCAKHLTPSIPRRELENHKNILCPLQPVNCPYFSIGCGVGCTGLVCRNVFNEHVNNAFNVSASLVAVIKNSTEANRKIESVIDFVINPKYLNFASTIMNEITKFTEIEQILIKKWIKKCVAANDFENLEILYNEVVVNFLNYNVLRNSDVVLKDCLFFEFKLPINTIENDVFDLQSPIKLINNNACSIGLSHFANNTDYFLSLSLDNVDRIKKIKAKTTYLNFPYDIVRNGIFEYIPPVIGGKKNISKVAGAFVLKAKNIEKDENNVENYVARFIVNIEFTF